MVLEPCRILARLPRLVQRGFAPRGMSGAIRFFWFSFVILIIILLLILTEEGEEIKIRIRIKIRRGTQKGEMHPGMSRLDPVYASISPVET